MNIILVGIVILLLAIVYHVVSCKNSCKTSKEFFGNQLGSAGDYAKILSNNAGQCAKITPDINSRLMCGVAAENNVSNAVLNIHPAKNVPSPVESEMCYVQCSAPGFTINEMRNCEIACNNHHQFVDYCALRVCNSSKLPEGVCMKECVENVLSNTAPSSWLFAV